jgi:hypothetical protein
MESGFFRDAAYIDTVGLYMHSSFNTPEGWQEVEDYRGRFDMSMPDTKYDQGSHRFKWSGVVLALQNPRDRSVASVGSEEEYYRFVKGACRFYEDWLFLKAHPLTTPEAMARFQEIATKYGVGISHSDHTVIEDCEFVLTWNSSFAVDCFLRGVPVVQFAPGCFYQTPAVVFTRYTYPNALPEDKTSEAVLNGHKLARFLLYRYCFSMAMPAEKWNKMADHFAMSKQLFPMTDEFCYANYKEA